jgi:hypothetical protein
MTIPVIAPTPLRLVLSGEAANPNLVIDVTRPVLEPMIYCTRGEYVDHYMTDAVTWILMLYVL